MSGGKSYHQKILLTLEAEVLETSFFFKRVVIPLNYLFKK